MVLLRAPLLVLGGVLSCIASAKPTSTATSSIRTSSVRTSSIKTGSIKPSSTKTSSIKTNSAKTSSVKTSSVKTSSVKVSTVKTTSTSHAATPTPTINNKPHFTYDELYRLLSNFWDHFIYPADVVQADSINSTIFAEDIQGRIDVTRNFTGRELNTEYIFGLFSNLAANAGSLSLLGVPLSYEIQKFSGNGYMNSASTKVMFNISSIGLVVPIIIDTWTSWNSLGQMTQYDGIFKHWGWLQDYVVETAMPLLGATTPTQALEILTPILSSQICKTATTYCNSTNTDAADLYASFDACYGFLTTEVRWGAEYEFGRNTLMCRMLHQNMVPFRPSVHCSHIGPTGGGMCTDERTYVSTVDQEYFDISWVPHTPPKS